MTTAPRTPSGLDRKAIRASAIDLHRLATDMRERRGMVPADEPPGYVDAFSAALRAMARLCEGARGVTCAQVKRLALDAAPTTTGAAEDLAGSRAVMALLVTINLNAQRMGVDPYEGLGR
jgi:hypothetical protein